MGFCQAFRTKENTGSSLREFLKLGFAARGCSIFGLKPTVLEVLCWVIQCWFFRRFHAQSVGSKKTDEQGEGRQDVDGNGTET
jgi:hypothetical protein